MNRLFVLAILGLASCGGGSDSDGTPPIRLEAGGYSMTFKERNELGLMLVGPDMSAVYFASRSVVGFGDWQSTDRQLMIDMQTLPIVLDDLRNDFPAAKYSRDARSLVVSAISDGFAGGELVFARRVTMAPEISTLPRNWYFRNIYRWGSRLLDYEMQIDIDSAGVLSGFDVNGCAFRGQVSSTAGPLYAVTIMVSNCGATRDYIENGFYVGYGYYQTDGSIRRLSVITVDRGLRLGLSFSIFPR